MKLSIAHLSEQLSGLLALDITADRIKRYVMFRQDEDAAPASIRLELAALRRMFNLAVSAGNLTLIPAVPKLDIDNARQGFVDPPEFYAVLKHLPSYLRDAVLFLYLVGWRKSEMRRLEWRDVDLREGVIRLRRATDKTKRGRPIVLQGELRVLFERRRRARRLNCRFVFHRNGRPVGDFRKAWRLACSKAGIPGLLVHDLRRSAVRNMIRAGVPERVAMEISGHRTRDIFDRYNIISGDDLADASERVSDYVTRRSKKTRRHLPLKQSKRGKR